MALYPFNEHHGFYFYYNPRIFSSSSDISSSHPSSEGVHHSREQNSALGRQPRSSDWRRSSDSSAHQQRAADRGQSRSKVNDPDPQVKTNFEPRPYSNFEHYYMWNQPELRREPWSLPSSLNHSKTAVGHSSSPAGTADFRYGLTNPVYRQLSSSDRHSDAGVRQLNSHGPEPNQTAHQNGKRNANSSIPVNLSNGYHKNNGVNLNHQLSDQWLLRRPEPRPDYNDNSLEYSHGVAHPSPPADVSPQLAKQKLPHIEHQADNEHNEHLEHVNSKGRPPPVKPKPKVSCLNKVRSS